MNAPNFKLNMKIIQNMLYYLYVTSKKAKVQVFHIMDRFCVNSFNLSKCYSSVPRLSRDIDSVNVFDVTLYANRHQS